jgi:Na+/H+-dicarboxylate symporter/ABC-type amino acid transport substrate-binding protein
MRSGVSMAAALGGGLLVGLFFGEGVSFFGMLADAYVRLLQMTVLPFIVLSIVSGIGRLDYAQARLLAMRVGLALGIIWALAIALVALFPLLLPPHVTASFFSSTLVESPPPLDLVALWVPSNPFNSLANAIVPAVVLFSLVMGASLIGVADKSRLIEVLEVAREAVAAAAALIVRFVPIGVFVIVAHAAGTMTLHDFQRLQTYVIGYAALALLLGLGLLPALITVLTGIPYRAVLIAYRDPLIAAFVTSDLFVVLPVLTTRTRELLQAHGAGRMTGAIDIIIPASFNFPHAGKLLSLTFVLFAAWFADVTVPAVRYPALMASGILAMFGNVNVAVPFLLDMAGVPADTFQLFLATGFINGRFGSLVAAMHTATVGLIGAWMAGGAIRLNGRSLVRFVVIATVMTGVVLGSARLFVSSLTDTTYTGAGQLMNMERSMPPQPAGRDAPRTHDPSAGSSQLALSGRGTLRVGYLPDSLPFAYTNARGALVGLDIDMAERLAAELGVLVRYVPLDSLNDTRTELCDIIMSGVAVTTDRAAAMVMSSSYLDETLALVIPDAERGRYASWADVERRRVRLAVPDLPYFIEGARRALPGVSVRTFSSVRAMFERGIPSADAFVLTAERGSAWTLLYPRLSVVVPTPRVIKIPLAYVVVDPDPAFIRFVDAWIDLKKKDGTIQTLYERWILGRASEASTPRWSIIRDVLHWVS